MVLGDLADEVQALNLQEPEEHAEPEYLLFNPSGDQAWLRETFNNIPRYLFRVSTPNSDGSTDRLWVKSKDARYARPNGRVDILTVKNNHQVAGALNRHLRWLGGLKDPDNLVSWTCSLLFALQYIFYRHQCRRDGSTLDSIDLCVVDTAAFPEGVFLQDMDLIRAYRSFDGNLWNLEELRWMKHRNFAGSFYFGEYLSQGALKIEGKCQIVSAQAIIDKGLFLLRPEFEELVEKAEWANKVICLREAFYQNKAERHQIAKEELKAAIDIAQLFGPRWRLPIAANLIALRPRRKGDSNILQTFGSLSFTGSPLLPAA